jgi:hypothetical protein
VRLDQLIGQLPKDTWKRVEKTRERFNPLVREALRQETGLKLNRSERARQDRYEEERVTVQITVESGLPKPLQEMDFTTEEAALFLIGRHQAELFRLRESLPGVQSLIYDMAAANDPLVSDGESQHAAETLLKLVDLLLKRLEADNLVGRILSVDEDVLGAYFPPAQRGRELVGRVELYWGVIGLMAQSLGTSAEALTVVVLAHELAHAYTHLGTDIDGERWDHEVFSQAEKRLLEGLAQYYTCQVCHQLEDTMPDAVQAYEMLLHRQSWLYRAHLDWLEPLHTSEEVRYAILESRRQDLRTLEDFEIALDRTRGSLGRKSPRPGGGRRDYW